MKEVKETLARYFQQVESEKASREALVNAFNELAASVAEFLRYIQCPYITIGSKQLGIKVDSDGKISDIYGARFSVSLLETCKTAFKDMLEQRIKSSKLYEEEYKIKK